MTLKSTKLSALVLLSLSFSLTTACGGSSSGETSAIDNATNVADDAVTYPTESASVITSLKDATAYDDLIDDPFSTSFDHTALVIEIPKGSLIFSIQQPTLGSLEIQSAEESDESDKIVYRFNANVLNPQDASLDTMSDCQKMFTLSKDTFAVTYYDINEQTVKKIDKVVDINLDPLLKESWHLCNFGQSSVTGNYTDIVAGKDINVLGSWLIGGNGQGVQTYVIDTGFDVEHEDMIDRIASSMVLTTSEKTHGTSVMGIIGANANNVGTRGVAYQTELNLIADGSLRFVSKALSYVFDAKINEGTFYEISPLNLSIGYALPYVLNAFTDLDNIENYVVAGILPVVASANYHSQRTLSVSGPYNLTPFYSSDSCYLNGTSCFFAQTTELVRSPYSIVVASGDSNGQRARYSNTGANLWVTAPGGTYGDGFHKVLTTDVSGCRYGYSRTGTSTQSDFERGLTANNQVCNYTAQFNGTSAATPMVTGIIANMLSVNKNLTANQIKYILATTASVDKTVSGALVPGSMLGWQTNGANISYSTEFGFGWVDAAKAVKLAKNYASNDVYDSSLDSRQVFPDIQEEITFNEASCKLVPNDSYLGQHEYNYECEAQLSGLTGNLEIENVQLDFEEVEILDDTKTPCNLLSSFHNLPAELSALSGTDNDLLKVSDFLRNLVVGVANDNTSNVYIVKAQDENFFGFESNALATNPNYLLVNGFYLENVTGSSIFKVYFGSDCPLGFGTGDGKGAVKLMISGYAN